MKSLKFALSLSLLMSSMAITAQSNEAQKSNQNVFEWKNPIKSGIHKGGLRDCQVFQADGRWYMTGTSAPHWGDGKDNPGVALYTSDNLNDWTRVGIIIPNPGPDKWYWQRFWAPEIAHINGKYYCTFNCKNDSMGVTQSFGLAVADNVEGPYTVLSTDAPIHTGNDANLFQDEDGRVYVTWCGGNDIHNMNFAEIDLENAKLKEPARVIFTSTPGTWDAAGVEGASLFKHNGMYMITYSSWTRGYEVGVVYATDINGPWMKTENSPIFSSLKKEYTEPGHETMYSDLGHNYVFTGPGDTLWFSCHGRLRGEDGPWLYMEPLKFDENGMVSRISPTCTPQQFKY